MKKILVVDDQSQIRELVEVTLRRDDFQIFQAENGEQAIQFARSHRPDLIIMDVMMPGNIDGLQATRILKSDPEMKASKIIMLTAQGQENDLAAGREAGADAYFVKPFSPLDLLKKVDEVLK
ncbi:response regulator transcription factor [Thermodesulfobacteriota bacterium]